MLASTRLGNVPINDKTLELMEDDIEESERLRDRWGRLHTLRETQIAQRGRQMAQVVNGRYTAGTDEPFVIFVIGMGLALHKDHEPAGRGAMPARSTIVSDSAPTV
jgi:hypothetical protein